MSRPSPGALWMQAHTETRDLPSFQRGQKCRERYIELMREHGHIVPAKPGDRRDLPCGWPSNRTV